MEAVGMKTQTQSLKNPEFLFSHSGISRPCYRPPHTSDLIDKVTGMYQYIELSTLVDVFFSMLRVHFKLDSIQLLLPDQIFHHGTKAGATLSPQCLNLSIKLFKCGADYPVSFSLYRTTRLSDAETAQLDTLIKFFSGPLSNAVSYASACHAACHDELTGLYNRGALKTTILSVNVEKPPPTALMVLDVDRFKSINDEYGHTAGDEVLRHFSRHLSSRTPDNDMLFRYGGDEFVIVHYSAGRENPLVIAETIRRSIEKNTINIDGYSINMTTTVGMTSVRKRDTIEQAFQRADAALMRGKQMGRNVVVPG